MAYGFYDKNAKYGVVSTNLKSIERESGISYNTLSNWMRNNNKVYDDDNYLLFKTDTILKGKQRIKNVRKIL